MAGRAGADAGAQLEGAGLHSLALLGSIPLVQAVLLYQGHSSACLITRFASGFHGN